MNYKEFEYRPHTADMIMIARGITYEELFRSALRGMFHAMQPEYTLQSAKREINSTGIDQEALLVNFLSECLCTGAIYHEAYTDSEYHTLTETTITATLFGKTINGYTKAEIKAVTYYELSIVNRDGILEATITFDI